MGGCILVSPNILVLVGLVLGCDNDHGGVGGRPNFTFDHNGGGGCLERG